MNERKQVPRKEQESDIELLRRLKNERQKPELEQLRRVLEFGAPVTSKQNKKPEEQKS